MKFEAFYKEAYDAEMEELFSDNASETENKPSKDSCDLLMKKANLEFSQYKLVKSEKCYDYLLANLYPKAAEIAKPQGDAADPEAECRRYEALCRSHPADLQILGVGHTGHIGFNEPADDFPELTHLVDLAPQTLAANARYFDDPDTMPRQAITVGLGVLMRAKRILLLLSGSGKAEITERLLCGRIVPQVPATILRLHPDVTAVIDEDALQLVRAHAPNLIP